MNFPFNFIIIPAIIIALAYFGRKATKIGLHPWYEHLRKPSWTPPGKLIGEIWFFLYVVTGLAVLWYWNVPYPGWIKYVTGAVLLANAYFHKKWNDTFFIKNDLAGALKVITYLNITGLVATVLIFLDSFYAAFLMLPYIVWVGVATNLNKQILHLNSEKKKQN